MTTIYVGNADTRLVTVTGGGVARPLGGGPYLWGSHGESTMRLARDMAVHACEGHSFEPDPDTVVAFCEELAHYRADQPFTLSRDSVLRALAMHSGGEG